MGIKTRPVYIGLMKLLISTAILSLTFAQSALAGTAQPARVVELFTSQGCSSCPPANQTITQVADDPDTLALSYGVTYWDYLGWKDTFADPKFTDRQRDYGRVFEMGNLYTPQIVLNGASHGARYSARDIGTMDLSTDRARVKLSLSETGLKANCDDGDASYQAVLVEYVAGPQTVPVKAGENRGRTLLLTNVVTDVVDLGLWLPAEARELNLLDEVQAGKSYALLLHDPVTGQVSSAATFNPEN